jgi:hypothetical protein
MLQKLDLMQRERGVHGHLLEIGVHHGKLFLLLAQLLRTGEKALAIDVFGNQDENISQSGRGSLEAFGDNAWNFLDARCLSNVQVLEANSAALRPGDLLNCASSPVLALGNFQSAIATAFRMASIDGCHSCKGVADDMELIAPCLHEGGLLLCDDVYHVNWQGVYQGTKLFLLRHPEFRVVYASPVVYGTNKVILCHATWAAYYFEFLKDVHKGTKLINYVKEPWSTLIPRVPREQQPLAIPANVPNDPDFSDLE